MKAAPAIAEARAFRSRMLARSPASVLVGLAGRGIAASRTPAMHEAAARALGVPYVYRLLDGDCMPPGVTIESILRQARLFGFDGLNITFPWKQDVIPLLDALSPEAASVGSVNTVTLRDGLASGHNTDCSGFRASFEAAMAGAPRENVLLLGAGGAGAAVAQALLDAGAGRVLVHDIHPDRAAALAQRLAGRNGAGRAVMASDTAAAAAVADGIVNATPVGMAKQPGSPIGEACVQPRHWVADIVYFPLETELLRAARAKGCRTLSGAGMAIAQAEKAFELFTGRKPDPAVMAAAFAAFDRGDPA